MAATSVSSFNFDKENDVSGSQLSARTPHGSKGLRLPSGSTLEDVPLKPGQRSLSNGTPSFNRSALQNVKNTPLKGAALQGGAPTFKTPVVVRPKVKQSPAVDAADPMSRTSSALPLEDEDYVGEFVAPEERISTYFNTLIKCNPLALWGFPCIPFTGSTSDEEEEDEHTPWGRTNRRQLDLPVHPMQMEDDQMLLSEHPIECAGPITEDLLPVTGDLHRHTPLAEMKMANEAQ